MTTKALETKKAKTPSLEKFSDITIRKSHWFLDNLPADTSLHTFRVLSFISASLQRYDYVITEHDPVGDTWRITMTSHDFANLFCISQLQARRSLEKAYEELGLRSDWFLRYECVESYNTLRYVLVLTPEFARHFASLSNCYATYNPIHTVHLDIFTLRLYEYLVRWRSTGFVRQASIDAVKRYLCDENSCYNKTALFMQKLEKSLETINRYTDITASYHKNMAGRAILGLAFGFKTKPFEQTYAYKNLDYVIKQGGFYRVLPDEVIVGDRRPFEIGDLTNGVGDVADVVQSYDADTWIDPTEGVGSKSSDTKKKTKVEGETDNEKTNLKTTTQVQTDNNPTINQAEETKCTQNNTETSELSDKKPKKDGLSDDNALVAKIQRCFGKMYPCSFTLKSKQHFAQTLSEQEIIQSIDLANAYILKKAQDKTPVTNIAGLYNKALSENWAKNANQQQANKEQQQQQKAELTEQQYQEQRAKVWNEMEQQRIAMKNEIEKRKQNKEYADTVFNRVDLFLSCLTADREKEFMQEVKAKLVGVFLTIFEKDYQDYCENGTNPHFYHNMMFQEALEKTLDEWEFGR